MPFRDGVLALGERPSDGIEPMDAKGGTPPLKCGFIGVVLRQVEKSQSAPANLAWDPDDRAEDGYCQHQGANRKTRSSHNMNSNRGDSHRGHAVARLAERALFDLWVTHLHGIMCAAQHVASLRAGLPSRNGFASNCRFSSDNSLPVEFLVSARIQRTKTFTGTERSSSTDWKSERSRKTSRS